MIGDKRKYNCALVTLRQKPKEDGTFAPELEGLSAEVSAASVTVVQAQADPAWIALIQKAIQTYNTEDAVSNAQKVQKFAILDTDFVPVGDDAELTATLKLKRPVVMRKYAEIIEAIYAGSGGHDVRPRK
jgi:long-subunit acyl-CoA synthetase (AMP-forming)|eukprot:COSAG01_NODE_2958_length_6794_cov_420.552054_1_plen_130_part_00